MGETTVDDKWRITIPPEVRGGFRKGQTLQVEREGERITIEPSVDIKKFERELKGCIKGSKIPPEKLKEIWGIRHRQQGCDFARNDAEEVRNSCR